MKVETTPISGVCVVETTPYCDNRGEFSRLFCTEELSDLLTGHQIKQINHSFSKDIGCIRGMHMQLSPAQEIKMIRCLKGRVWDVALDVRKDSPTFLNWFGIELSPVNRQALIIPEGCAHGFQCLENQCELLYLHTEQYSREHEFGLNVFDPLLDIKWPIRSQGLSQKDESYPFINSEFYGV